MKGIREGRYVLAWTRNVGQWAYSNDPAYILCRDRGCGLGN